MPKYLKSIQGNTLSENVAADFGYTHITWLGDYVKLSNMPTYQGQEEFDMKEIKRPIKKWWLEN